VFPQFLIGGFERSRTAQNFPGSHPAPHGARGLVALLMAGVDGSIFSRAASAPSLEVSRSQQAQNAPATRLQ
jgi:hypothetical protein